MATPNGFRRLVTDAIGAMRDRITTRERFVRFASRVPGLRFIARRRAARVFDLCAGFVYSQILLSCVDLDLFRILAEHPVDLEELTARLDLPEESVERLLRGAIALDLVEQRSNGRFGLGPLGAAVVSNPGVTEMVWHHRMLYDDLRDPIALLGGATRGKRMTEYWSYATAEDPRQLASEEVADYSDLMASSQHLIADQVLRAYSLRRHRALLDVGGGLGAFVTAAARRAPHLRFGLFDLPAVADRARATLAEAGLADRVEVSGGSFFEDPLPRGYDIVTLVRILHDHDDEPVHRLLAQVRAALDVGGTLLIAEPMADTPGARAVGDAYFSMYLLAMGSGRARTPAELTSMLEANGFGDVKLLGTDLPLQTRVLRAVAVRT